MEGVDDIGERGWPVQTEHAAPVVLAVLEDEQDMRVHRPDARPHLLVESVQVKEVRRGQIGGPPIRLIQHIEADDGRVARVARCHLLPGLREPVPRMVHVREEVPLRLIDVVVSGGGIQPGGHAAGGHRVALRVLELQRWRPLVLAHAQDHCDSALSECLHDAIHRAQVGLVVVMHHRTVACNRRSCGLYVGPGDG